MFGIRGTTVLQTLVLFMVNMSFKKKKCLNNLAVCHLCLHLKFLKHIFVILKYVLLSMTVHFFYLSFSSETCFTQLWFFQVVFTAVLECL